MMTSLLPEFEKKNTYYQNRINDFLSAFLKKNYKQSTLLLEALSYSLLSGGKRIRPLLSYATAEALGIDAKQADYVAASVEMIHAYSLIHDDLPAMDDDDLRRGMPTCHVKFGDAMAILAGDALQAMAFEVLTQVDSDPKIIVKLIQKLSYSCGAVGMAGGQALDLESENMQLQQEEMDNIHQLKTGALISASVEMTGLLFTGFRDGQKLAFLQLALKQYAYGFGMAFQIIDDVLDVIGTESEIGKPVGSDESNNKSTYPAIIGLDASKKAALKHSHYAIEKLNDLPEGDSSYLKYLAEYLVSRQS
ncbi:MAG: polyprenyl synthetase family protein [Marinicellaceae bacterium]